MNVDVYVEGPSDVASMQALLAPLVEQKRQQLVQITFYPVPKGDKKKWLLLEMPRQAPLILKRRSQTIIIVIPDLYPRNKGFDHETPAQLSAGLETRVETALRENSLDMRLKERFKSFCFKHDLEALVLAAHTSLASYLNIKSIPAKWTRRVEDLNHQHPPKRILEQLFKEAGRFYRESVDAPLILGRADYRALAEACPQCFQPFVAYLERL